MVGEGSCVFLVIAFETSVTDKVANKAVEISGSCVMSKSSKIFGPCH